MDLFVYNDPMLDDVERTIGQMFDRGFTRWGLSPRLSTLPTAEDVAVDDADEEAVFSTRANVGQHAFDVIEKENAYELIGDAPGCGAADVHVELDKDVLTVSGRPLKKDHKKEGNTVWRRERRTQRFWRSFTLPQNAQREGITAMLDKGVLTVRVPKVPEPPMHQPKRIKVQLANE